MGERVEIVETVRDAWQGLTRIPSTDEKVGFIRGLLSAGFRPFDDIKPHLDQWLESDAEEATRAETDAL